MAYLDPKQAFADLKTNVVEGLQAHFPLTGSKQSVHLESIDVRPNPFDHNDFAAQQDTKLKGKTWSAPVFGTLALKNNATGEVIDRKSVKLADIPQMTPRYSYIVNGKEVQVDNQWRLKRGVYTQRQENGVLKTQFQTEKKSFDVTLDPETKVFSMRRGESTKIPVYPLMKQLGVDDDTLAKSWGKDILNANRNARGSNTALEQFFKADKGRKPTSIEEARQHFTDQMEGAKVRPDSTKITLGKPYTSVNGDMLHNVTTKMIGVQRGEIPEDERDSLVFKDLHTAADAVKEKLTNWATKNTIQDRVQRKINNATNIRDVVKGDLFSTHVNSVFTSNSLARTADQTNPVQMVAASFQTTIMGAGGIQGEHSITEDAKLISPSHLGFLDPIHTPEGGKTGVTTHLPIAINKVGNTPTIPVYNLKTQKMDRIDPITFHQSRVVLPDQVKWDKGKPVPVAAKVTMSQKGNDINDGHFKDADYVMRHPSQLFSVTTNLIPFLGNNSGNRATYADKQIEQAISLKGRDAPLVQVSTGGQGNVRTFEDLLGRQSSHLSPVEGTVKEITENHIIVQDHKGEEHKVHVYNNFPLNDPKAVLHSTPLVKVGDKVGADQVLADTNFTRNGTLALGKNLRVGYIPMKGYNFEDGVVISETAAKKLESEHLYKPSTTLSPELITGLDKFKAFHATSFTRDQFAKLGQDGVIQVGQKVNPGDPLIVAARPYTAKGSSSIDKLKKSLSGKTIDQSLTWRNDRPGEVVAVNQDNKGNTIVHVRTVEPMQIGDKITGRYGNKGIVTAVVPDHEMPHTINDKGEKEPIEVALNPSGVPGRMNMGQVLETAASKIALKTGQPYVVQNFGHDVDALDRVKKELKQHGLSDTEILHDPVSGQVLGPALVGQQHMLKLNFQIDKKVSVRSGMPLEGAEPEHYDADTLIPAGGGKTGAQSMGNLGLYAMLAHGAKANIREMQTWKSEGPDRREKWDSLHNAVWNAIQEGEVPPPPKKTFAFQKFEDMLRGAGVDVQKKGHQLQLTPMTDKQIVRMSAGALPNPGYGVMSKLDSNGEPVTRKGGVFDPALTGGHGGTKWTHIELPEHVPNPMFEKAIMNVTGLTNHQYSGIVNGEMAVHKDTREVVPAGTKNSIAGGPGIAHLLSSMDLQKELQNAKDTLAKYKIPDNIAHQTGTLKVDQLAKKVRFLTALDQAGVHPGDAYVLKNLPVLPPVMRPSTVLPDGTVNRGDLNELYTQVGGIVTAMKAPNFKYLGDNSDDRKMARKNLYDGVKTLMGLGENWGDRGENAKGLLLQVSGSQPKKGYFQDTLLSRRQDMTMRGTITPEPGLGLDNVGLPEKKALDLFRPFVVKKLVDMGMATTPREAQTMLSADKKDPAVYRALDKAMQERPVLLKRDPALHKHSVQAFWPQRVSGKSIQIHPLVTGGFSADFDGDTMAVYVPIGKEAVNEAKKMVPSSNIYNEASGQVMYQPTHEASLGLFKLSRVTGDGKQSFDTHADLLKAAQDGKLKMTDKAVVDGKTTTAGRVMLASSVPDALHDDLLHNLDTKLNKKGVEALYTKIAEDHTDSFADSAAKLMRLGYDASFGAIKIPNPNTKGTAAAVQKEGENPKDHVQFLPMGTHSFSLNDFTPDKETRDPIIAATQKKVDAIQANKSMDPRLKEHETNEAWFDATEKMEKIHKEKMSKDPNNLFIMQQAGIKPGPDQYRQLCLAPMLMVDSTNRIISKPVAKSYSEGLSVGDYWNQMSGARRGNVLKVQEVSNPGILTKNMMNTALGAVVTQHDCGTEQGIHLPVSSQDIFDRTLAQDHTIGGTTYLKNTIVTPQLASTIRAADKNASLLVRSTLKCENGEGVCQQCAGLAPHGEHYSLGTNLGVLATQALGERATQLTLKAFHSGGLAVRGANMVNSFSRVEQLTKLPQDIPDEARLAKKDGIITKIEEDPTGHIIHIDDIAHHIPNDSFGNPLYLPKPGETESTGPGGMRWTGMQVGMKVKAGQMLTDPARTNVNPHTLYEVTGNMNEVQNHIVTELHDIYGREGVRRQNTETMVRAIGDLTRVVDPGGSDAFIKGQFASRSQIQAMNRQLVANGQPPVAHTPILKGVDVMPLEVQEDWIAKLNHNNIRESLQESAAIGATSNLHGVNPIPGIAYGAEFGLNKEHPHGY